MGIAYLPDGRRMQYEQYLKTPEWKNKKVTRLAIDNWQCGFCHCQLDDSYHTHHLNYSRLGHEDVDLDIISLCKSCHNRFHDMWERKAFWESSPIQHWKDFSLPVTAQLCHDCFNQDYFFGGQLNLCSDDTIFDVIDGYLASNDIHGVYIDTQDVKMFFRNKRYDVLLEAVSREEKLEDMLDRMFGPKGGKGGNPVRAAARSFLTKHPVSAIKRIYKENQNVLILMDAVNKLKEINNE